MTKPESNSATQVTRLLREAGTGDDSAFDRLLPLVYDELRRLAQSQMRRERSGHTLNTTGLVHEAYLRLVDQTQVEWKNRNQFFGIAARAMRQILVDYARRKGAQKRGGEWQRTTLGDVEASSETSPEELIALDDALKKLAEADERLCRIVEYRFFGGMTEEEIAGLLDVTVRTVQREWSKARAWLYKDLYSNGG